MSVFTSPPVVASPWLASTRCNAHIPNKPCIVSSAQLQSMSYSAVPYMASSAP